MSIDTDHSAHVPPESRRSARMERHGFVVEVQQAIATCLMAAKTDEADVSLHPEEMHRLAETLDWEPRPNRPDDVGTNLIAAAEQHTFVGRVIDIDRDEGVFEIMARRRRTGAAIGDEMPVQLPIGKLPTSERRKLRVGARVDWTITETPRGDGSSSSENRFTVHAPRAFTHEQEVRIQARVDQLRSHFVLVEPDAA